MFTIATPSPPRQTTTMAKRKSNVKSKYVKAPQAPRRFKSAYMFYSTAKHKEIRSDPANKKVATTAIAKMISQTWKSMSDSQREEFHEMARQDRTRYEEEKAAYTGPWKVTAQSLETEKTKSKKSDKDDNSSSKDGAPKHPPSVFILYMNKIRPQLRDLHPHLSGNELTRMIAQQWKDASLADKEPYVQEFNRQRDVFRQYMRQWQLSAAFTKNDSPEAVVVGGDQYIPSIYSIEDGDEQSNLLGKEINCSIQSDFYMSNEVNTFAGSSGLVPQLYSDNARSVSLNSADSNAQSDESNYRFSTDAITSLDPLFCYHEANNFNNYNNNISSSVTANSLFLVSSNSVVPNAFDMGCDDSSGIGMPLDFKFVDPNNHRLIAEAVSFIPNMNDFSPINDEFAW